MFWLPVCAGGSVEARKGLNEPVGCAARGVGPSSSARLAPNADEGWNGLTADPPKPVDCARSGIGLGFALGEEKAEEKGAGAGAEEKDEENAEVVEGMKDAGEADRGVPENSDAMDAIRPPVFVCVSG